ncbi:hypothetical protein L1887_04322 [Cichorium endivia]|nr:hypothetical protein L1887_04322 [Cichorium endivia]
MMAGAQWTVILLFVFRAQVFNKMPQRNFMENQNLCHFLSGLFLGYYRRRNKIFSVLYWMVSLKLLLHVAAIY